MTRTIIAGSRVLHDIAAVNQAMAECGWQPSLVLCGMARGVDTLGEQWAQMHGIPVAHYPADWAGQGLSAGHNRNAEMAANADALVAIWNGRSPGTRNMIERARSDGLRVHIHMVQDVPPPPPTSSVPPPPPAIHKLPLGTRLAVGLGFATVNAELDMETYSEAGYIWDEAERKWQCPPGAVKKGLPVIGLDNYARHPTTQILMFAYDLKDGLGWRWWCLGMPFPADLAAHIAAGRVIEAHNVSFESRMWQHVGVARYGWPPVGERQWRCSAAKARSYALPGSLGQLGKVLALPIQKDARGEALMKVFSMPRNPTKGDPRTRIPLQYAPPAPPPPGARIPKAYKEALQEHQDSLDYVQYNITDIVAEAEASGRMPDLEGEELEWWLDDQRINARGVQVDVEGLENCAEIVRQALAKYESELLQLTGIDSANKVQQLLAFLAGRGVHLDSLDEEAVEEGLKRANLDPVAKRVLEIRQAAGSASVKKVFAMLNRVSPDGRMRDLYVFCGAHTGRSTSEGPQAANLPSAGPHGHVCPSCSSYFAGGHVCPVCSWVAPPGKPLDEWTAPGSNAPEQALELFKQRDVNLVERRFGSALHTVAGCLRGLYVAGPGKDLISSDYNSIEAVGLAMLAGEKWRIETFRTHGKIYEASAAAAFGISFEEFMLHRGYTAEQLQHPEWWTLKPANKGGHHPLRKKGKVLELACLGADTLVLTDRGYVPIIEVAKEHKLWDGDQWVSHAGLLHRGDRETMRLDGVEITPDHLVNCNGSWTAAGQLSSNASTLCQALATGSANLPASAMTATERSPCSAPAGRAPTWSTSTTCCEGRPRGARCARSGGAEPRERRISSTPNGSPMTNTDSGCSIASPPRSEGAIGQGIEPSTTTVDEGSGCTPRGWTIDPSSANTSSRCPGGTTPRSKWTGSTSTGTTPPGTCGSSPSGKTCSTGGPCPNYSAASPSLRPVFDIADAGPRNRFTIATDSGHLIVHNCGYGGWVGSAHAFGMPGTDEEIADAILRWRAASPSVVWLWGGQTLGKANDIRKQGDKWDRSPHYFGVEGAYLTALLDKGREYPVTRLDGTATGISFIYLDDTLHCKLPSPDHTIKYHRPRLTPGRRQGELLMSFEGWNTNPKNGPKGWIRKDTWGSRVVENINQAICRDVLRPAVRRLEASGRYLVVMHTYDEVVCEVEKCVGTHEEFEALVEERPPFAHDWPIRAPDSWRGFRYRKA